MYKIETHLHTAEVSACAKLSGGEMVKLYKDAGYDLVFISDHYSKKYFEKLGDLSWEEKTKRYLSGYESASKAGEKLGVKVLLAMELTFVGSRNDYLVYGVTKEFLDAYPALYQSNIEEFYPLAKSLGLLVVQAHPYRDNVCFPVCKFVDGLEIYNSNPRHNDFNDQAEETAVQEKLFFTAGSDAHRLEDVALSGMLSEKPICTSKEFISLIESGKAVVIRG